MKNKNLEIGIQPKYFQSIKIGDKTVEGRINSKLFSNLCVGDTITFKCNKSGETIDTIVLNLNTYSTFLNMLEVEGLQNMLPGIIDLKEGVNIYESIKGYKTKCLKLGCLAIKIKTI